MSKHYQQLTFADRQIIERQLAVGFTKTDIAACLGLSLSGLYRELSRVRPSAPYNATAAQMDRQRKRENRRLPSTLSRYPGLAEYIARQILDHGQTPAAIAKAIRSGQTSFPPDSISASTIYNHIRAGSIPGVSTEYDAR